MFYPYPLFGFTIQYLPVIPQILIKNGLITAFLSVGILILIAELISKKVFRNKIPTVALAIFMALMAAFIAGGPNGAADIPIMSGLALLGGTMLRDFTVVATAMNASLDEIRKAGWLGFVSIFLGLILTFFSGAACALLFGYRDAVSLATIGAGACTFIVGPVTGTALGASSEVIAISIAAGVVKSIAVTIGTPLVAKWIGLNNPQTAMIYGGMLGTTSGVAAGLAATDPRLVPYGALTATFYTGMGCLLCPSLFFLVLNLYF